MSQDQALSLTAALMMLTLVGGSLIVRRRLSMGTFIRLGLVWLAIFAGLFLIVQLVPGLVAHFT